MSVLSSIYMQTFHCSWLSGLGRTRDWILRGLINLAIQLMSLFGCLMSAQASIWELLARQLRMSILLWVIPLIYHCSVSNNLYDNTCGLSFHQAIMFLMCWQVIVDDIHVQDTNIVDFEPSLLPVQPNDEVVNVSYGLQSFDRDSYQKNEMISIVLDTPYNVKDVSSSEKMAICHTHSHSHTLTHRHTHRSGVQFRSAVF